MTNEQYTANEINKEIQQEASDSISDVLAHLRYKERVK